MPNQLNTVREAQRFPDVLSHTLFATFKHILLLWGMVIVAACSAPAPAAPSTVTSPSAADVVAVATAQPVDSPTAVPATAPADAATEAVEPTVLPPTATPVPEPEDWTETVTVEGDLFVRGNPAAPIRLVDYSDFM